MQILNHYYSRQMEEKKADQIVRIIKWVIGLVIVIWITFTWQVSIKAESLGYVMFLLLIVATVDMIWKNLKNGDGREG